MCSEISALNRLVAFAKSRAVITLFAKFTDIFRTFEYNYAMVSGNMRSPAIVWPETLETLVLTQLQNAESMRSYKYAISCKTLIFTF